MPCTRRVRRLALAALWLGVHTSSLCAGTPVPTELLDALKSSDFRAREDATNQLIGRADFKLKDLDLVLKSPNLTAEQHARLLKAARSRFFDGPRAALGVGFDPFNQFGANVIQRTFPKFPSSTVLRPGDQLLEIDGWTIPLTGGRFNNNSTARPYIICHDPGDVVPIKVNRDGIEMVLDVPLGRFSDLQGGEQLSEEELAAAWQVRSAKYNPPIEEAIRPQGLPARNSFSANTKAMNFAMNPDVWTAVGGGVPRGGREEFNPEAEAGRRPQAQQDGVLIAGGEVIINGRRMRNGDMVGNMRVEIGPNGVRLQGGNLPDGRDILKQQLNEFATRIDSIDKQLEDENLDDAARDRLKMRRGVYEQQRLSLQRKLQLQDDPRQLIRP